MGQDGAGLRLRLLGSFELSRDATALTVPLQVRRLLAAVALGHPQQGAAREVVSRTLWPEQPAGVRRRTLSAALWRARQAEPDLLAVTPTRLRLGDRVVVDIHAQPDPSRITDLTAAATVAAEELLPSWPDDWLIAERERVRARQLESLEDAAGRLLAERELLAALRVALVAERLDPWRESVQEVLLDIHLAEGNTSEASCQYQRYRERLRSDLAIAPSDRITRRVAGL